MENKRIVRMKRGDYQLLKHYLSEMGTYEFLSKEREMELIKKGQSGDLAARNRVVVNHLRFVVKTALENQGYGIELEDLINEGNLGLLRAFDKFDTERGCSFISYAGWWVKQFIQQAIQEKSSAIRIPVNRLNQIKKIRKTMSLYEDDPVKGKKRASQELEMSEAEIDRLIKVDSVTTSLDEIFPNQKTTTTLKDTLSRSHDPTPEKDLEGCEIYNEIDKVLSRMSEREQIIAHSRLELRGSDKRSLVELSVMLNLSKERIRQIELKILNKLREAEDLRELIKVV